ncbi:MAG: hypothetical protein ACKOTZ_12455 [Chloroflexota bacterium]
MADLPVQLADPALRDALIAAADPEGRIPRALAELGPLADRDVVLLDPDAGLRAGQLADAAARVVPVPLAALADVPDGSADVVAGFWNAIAPGEAAAADEVGHAMRILRPGGRLLLVHAYGRDDVLPLVAPEQRERAIAWSRPRGPFLGNGFRVRVLHCTWAWPDLDAAAAFLGAAFGAAGATRAAELARPRLEWKVALYHRDRDVRRVVRGAAGAAA